MHQDLNLTSRKSSHGRIRNQDCVPHQEEGTERTQAGELDQEVGGVMELMSLTWHLYVMKGPRHESLAVTVSYK
jgi:hypothetical protein